ncbi:MAG: Ldh family oxidoreductase [candidate division NC10 bacterium]|nr:Ldh family oxidoreductase [candidate division NC10 bacterium]
MAGVDDGVFFPAEKLRAWTELVFQRIGVSREDAALLTDSMIEANLRGVDTHGITRMLCVYVKRMQVGVVNPKTQLQVVREHPSTALIDCRNGIGQVASRHAMRLTMEKAKTTGVAFVATTHSNHYGMAAYWAMMALPAGMIGFSSTNAPAAVAPTGGRTPMMGTNPFAIAIPAGVEQPMVLDMATTVVARGRIILHAKQNKPLEPGWAFDERGAPTTDPLEAAKGLLAPIGGYKGYGIALAVDFLSGVLTGSNYGAHFPGFLADNLSDPTDVGSIFAAINVANFMDLPEFQARMDAAIREIKASAKAEGVTRIYIPGEIEFETRAKRLAEGIPIPEQIVQDFVALGKEVGVPFPAVGA